MARELDTGSAFTMEMATRRSYLPSVSILKSRWDLIVVGNDTSILSARRGTTIGNEVTASLRACLLGV